MSDSDFIIGAATSTTSSRTDCDLFSPQSPYIYGSTMLHKACKENSLFHVKEILKNKNENEVHCIDQQGLMPLHIAAKEGNLEIVRLLVESGAKVNARQTTWGVSSLDYACEAGNTPVAEYLIDHGADVTARDLSKWTPLHRGCYSGVLEIVKLLVKKGGDLSARDALGYTPLHRTCITNGPLEMIRWIMDHVSEGKQTFINDSEAPASLLHLICGKGNLDVVKYFIEYGEDIWARSETGQTILHRACESGSLDTVVFLVGLGLDVNARDINEKTPLHVACTCNHDVIFRYLVKSGGDVTSLDRHQMSLLHIACEHGFGKIVACLLEQGASVSQRSREGYTPLHVASRENYPGIINSLVANGADVNEVTGKGTTALHQAFVCDNVNAVKTLLQHGANPNMASKSGRMPYQVCSEVMKRSISIDLIFTGVDLFLLYDDLSINKYTSLQYISYIWGGLPPNTSKALSTLEFITPDELLEQVMEILFAYYPHDLYRESLKSEKCKNWPSGYELNLPSLKTLSRATIRRKLGTQRSILPNARDFVTSQILPASIVNYVFLRDEAMAVFKDNAGALTEFFTSLSVNTN